MRFFLPIAPGSTSSGMIDCSRAAIWEFLRFDRFKLGSHQQGRSICTDHRKPLLTISSTSCFSPSRFSRHSMAFW